MYSAVYQRSLENSTEPFNNGLGVRADKNKPLRKKAHKQRGGLADGKGSSRRGRGKGVEMAKIHHINT